MPGRTPSPNSTPPLKNLARAAFPGDNDSPNPKPSRKENLMKLLSLASTLVLIATCTAHATPPTTSPRPDVAMASAAQQPAIQNAFATDAAHLSDKFSALAGAMAGKYDWRPGKGVRSVGEVFNLIVMENGMLTGVLTGKTTQPAGKPEPITDPAKMPQAIADSYKALQAAINGLSASDLDTPVKLFGRDMTKQGALMILLPDQHEHLGQSIAYARMNSVVPPWSK